MHKDPPPGLFDRPAGVIVTYGLLTGFLAGVLVFAAWSFLAKVNSSDPTKFEPPLVQQRP